MKDLLFLPIDIDLSTLNFTQVNDPHPSTKWNGFWNASFITEKTIKDNNLQTILDQLPFTQITRFFHKVQTVVVPAHIDVTPDMNYEPEEFAHIRENEPCGYRFVLKGSTDKLFVKNNTDWVQATLPSVPCCYVLNSTKGLHKLAMDEGRETLYVRGFIDPLKQKELIERSLEKYKDYAIYL
jgi:hypothetical protein